MKKILTLLALIILSSSVMAEKINKDGFFVGAEYGETSDALFSSNDSPPFIVKAFSLLYNTTFKEIYAR